MSHSKQRRTRSAAAAAVGAAVAGSAVLLAAPVASATTVDVDYQCKTPIGNKGAVSPIDIKSTKSDEGYKLTMSFEKGVSSSPIELGKGAMKPSAKIKLGGAETGDVAVSGPANDEAIPANTPIKIPDLSGTYTPKKSGKVTFTASTLTIKALGTTTTCTPKNDPKPSLTLDVTAGGSGGSDSGGASGGDSGGDSSGGGSTGGGDASGGAAADGGGQSSGGGELPKTGPTDSAVALGTLGGTVLLAGVGGTLWVTRRRAAVRP
ncbi:LPXTG cell wall anchor domain-containing protein [Streptomyces qinglanensis]|uniref:LPXTG-motif cell wall anchor domain-containing protein n=1 Tax=Streptomyces qinglanensis TaxID=943816 RepID=A0A1H9VJQ6_9ACTN|nr:LPXTG cell wall anchor domain-containing protein [Streptomyces qinglanensis]SES21577.1 LPXTG-motif cell wall anchor domain-containing protein [Streptomyces qinglanensis]